MIAQPKKTTQKKKIFFFVFCGPTTHSPKAAHQHSPPASLVFSPIIAPMAGWKGAMALFLEPGKNGSELEVQSLFVKLNSLIKEEGNSSCADCGSSKISSISVNLGTFLCLKCAMAHTEALKSNISSIIPADTERLKSPGSWIHHVGANLLIRWLQSMGNQKANSYWEANFINNPGSPQLDSGNNLPIGSFSSALGVFVKPDESTDNATRKVWMNAKYMKRAFADRSLGFEASIRLRREVSQLHATFMGSDIVLESADATGKRTKPAEILSLASGTLRLSRDSNGEIESFDVQTKSSHFQVIECQEMTEFLFWVFRCGCALLPPKSSMKERGTLTKKSFSRIGKNPVLGMDLSNPLSVTSYFDSDLTLTGSNTSSQSMSVSSPTLSDPIPEIIDVSIDDILLKTTEQEMSHLKQDKVVVDGALTELQFRQRKLQKKLEACNSALEEMRDKGEVIETKMGVLNDSLTTFHEAEGDEETSLIEILCEKNPLCSGVECPETTERLLEMSHGEIRCGSLNELITILTHPELCKPSFRFTFLLTFQSFTDPSYLLSRLFSQFSLSDERILAMINETQAIIASDPDYESDLNLQKLSKALAADPKAKAFASISARRANELIASKHQPFKVSTPKRSCFHCTRRGDELLSCSICRHYFCLICAKLNPSLNPCTEADVRHVFDRNFEALSTESSDSSTSTYSNLHTTTTTTEKDQDDRTEDTGTCLTEDVVSSRAKTPTPLGEFDEKTPVKKSRSKPKVNKKDLMKKQDGEGYLDSPKKRKLKKEGKRSPILPDGEEESANEVQKEKGEKRSGEGKEKHEENSDEKKSIEIIDEGSNKTKAKSGSRGTRSGTNDKNETQPKSETEPKVKAKLKPRSGTTNDKTKIKPETLSVSVESEPKSRSRSNTLPRDLEASSEMGAELEAKSKKAKSKSRNNDLSETSSKGGSPRTPKGKGSPRTPKGKSRTKSRSGSGGSDADGEKGDLDAKPKQKSRSSSIGGKNDLKRKGSIDEDLNAKVKPKARSSSFGAKNEIKSKSRSKSRSPPAGRSPDSGKIESQGKSKAEPTEDEEEGEVESKSKKSRRKSRSGTVGVKVEGQGKLKESVGGESEIVLAKSEPKSKSKFAEEGKTRAPQPSSSLSSLSPPIQNNTKGPSAKPVEGDEGEAEVEPKSKSKSRRKSKSGTVGGKVENQGKILGVESKPKSRLRSNSVAQEDEAHALAPSHRSSRSVSERVFFPEEQSPGTKQIVSSSAEPIDPMIGKPIPSPGPITSSAPNFRRGESFDSQRGSEVSRGPRELKKRGSVINRRKKSIQKQFKRKGSASTSIGLMGSSTGGGESPSVSPLVHPPPSPSPTDSPASTCSDIESPGLGMAKNNLLCGETSSPLSQKSSGELSSMSSSYRVDSTSPMLAQKGLSGNEGGEGKGGLTDDEKSLVSVARMKSDPDQPILPRTDPINRRTKKRASTLCSAPLPEFGTKKFIQPLTIDDFLSEDQPDRVEIWRNQIRVRVMNVLRHWLEDHWQDFETSPHLLYQLIKWMNDVLIPSGRTSMANSLKKTMAKKLDSANSALTAPLVFSKKAPTPILPKAENCELLEHDPVELARQVCLKQQRLYRAIFLREFMDQKWNKGDKNALAPGIVAFIEDFNELSTFVTRSIVMHLGIRKRIKHVEKWIQVASKCREQKNFNATMAIISGLRASSVFRLKKTWAGIESKLTSTYEQLQELMSQENNWQKYRQSLGSGDPPCIPYLGVYLTDLTFLDDANPNTLGNGAINFEKRRKLVNLIEEVHQYQQEPYHFIQVKGIQEELKKAMKEGVGGGFTEQDLFNFSLIVEPKGS